MNRILLTILKGMLMLMVIFFFIVSAVKYSHAAYGAGLFLLASFGFGIVYYLIKDE